MRKTEHIGCGCRTCRRARASRRGGHYVRKVVAHRLRQAYRRQISVALRRLDLEDVDVRVIGATPFF